MSHTLPIIIVLSITAALNFQLVQLFKTGYEYGSQESLTDVEIYNDLKCTYLYNGLTHLRLGILLFHYSFVTLSKNDLIYNISYPSKTIKSQIGTLYGFDGVSIGSLWLLHLYTSLLSSYHDVFKGMNKPEIRDEMQNIHDTHKYVIKQLESEASDCREDNLYNWFDEWINELESEVNSDDIKLTMKENNIEAQNLLTENFGCDSLNTDMNDKLRLRNLYMKNLGQLQKVQHDLMNVYNVQVNWHDVEQYLLDTWNNARRLNWATDNLQNIIEYYRVQFAFLKVILFRLSCKHLEYSKGHVYEAFYAQQWWAFIIDFKTFLHIEGDPDIDDLQVKFYELANEQIHNISVKTYLMEKLHNIGASINVEATGSIILDRREFTTHFEGARPMDATWLNLANSSREEPIEFYSLATATMFLLHLKSVYTGIDFGIVQSFIKYIKETNQQA